VSADWQMEMLVWAKTIEGEEKNGSDRRKQDKGVCNWSVP